MKIKNISRILTFGILLNSISINSFAGVLSEDGRYETFEGNNISIPKVLEEDKVEIEIKGNTLVNLYNVDNIVTSGQTRINESKISVNTSATNRFSNFFNSDVNMLKSNTLYTIVVDINKNTMPQSDSIKIYSSNGENSKDPFSRGNNLNEYYEIKGGVLGRIVFSAYTGDISTSQYMLRSYFDNKSLTEGSEVELSVMVLEGDYTANTPEYFKGIKSSFEDQLVTQEMVDSGEEKIENLGKYKVEVKTTGKNLFNKNNVVLNKILTNATTVEANASWVYSDFIKVEPNTNYILTNIDSWYSYQYDKNKNPIDGNRLQNSFTTANNCAFIRVSLLKNNLDVAQIEHDVTVTDYEPYKELINIFYLDFPLLEGDTVEYKNGQAYHVRRSGRVIADGSIDEWWYLNNPLVTGQGYQFVSTGGRTLSSSSDIVICDKIPSYGGYDNESYSNNIWVHKNDTLVIHHPTISSNEEFNLWLKNNPITVVYKLKNPIYEPIKADLSVNLFKGTTHISNNSNISANMEITVDRILNRAIEAIELAKTNPTVENLSRARMWTNLLKESVKKDQLQSEIDNVTNINDLQLERKSITANMDIYIKCENMLSMSLDTNNITFEDFSGIEDMEKNDVVQISINSSLPYQLNAYLPVEIQNTDKTKTMDKDILNIKENSEATYQTFVNTTDKIILKDNCSAGNDLIHGVDIKLKGGIAHEKDVYKTTIKFEAEQK